MNLAEFIEVANDSKTFVGLQATSIRLISNLASLTHNIPTQRVNHANTNIDIAESNVLDSGTVAAAAEIESCQFTASEFKSATSRRVKILRRIELERF